MRQHSNLGYALRLSFIFSGVAILVCYACLTQQWNPYQYRSDAYNSFVHIINQIYTAAGFIFFATALLEVCFDTLDRRVSAIVLLLFIGREYTRLGLDDRTFLLMVVIVSGVVFYLMRMVTYRRPSASTTSLNSNASPIDSSRLHLSGNGVPIVPDPAQPASVIKKANRLAGFRAFGDLLPPNLSRQLKKKKHVTDLSDV